MESVFICKTSGSQVWLHQQVRKLLQTRYHLGNSVVEHYCIQQIPISNPSIDTPPSVVIICWSLTFTYMESSISGWYLTFYIMNIIYYSYQLLFRRGKNLNSPLIFNISTILKFEFEREFFFKSKYQQSKNIKEVKTSKN